MIPPILSAFCLATLVVFVFSAIRKWRRRSPYEHIPGPDTSAIGYLLEMHNPDGLNWHFDMSEKYGHVARLKGGVLMSDALYVSDPAALQAILVRDQHIFLESNEFAGLFGIIHHGDGVASVAGAEHKKQRKLMDPVFNNNRMAKLTPLFYNVVHQLQSSLVNEVAEKPPGHTVDILERLTRTSLEMIAQAGLGHTFNSFDPQSKDYNDFHWAITSVLPLASGLFLFLPYLNTWRNMQPVWLRKFLAAATAYLPWSTPWKFKKAVDAMWPVYRKLYAKKMAALEEGGVEALDNNPTGGQDLMTVIFKANHEAAERDKLADDSVMANISSLVHGAQETTSSILARFIDLLSSMPELQERIRAEVKQAKEQKEEGEDLNFSELNSLPLMDAVIKETFRIFSPVTFVWRQTTQDTVIPLHYPIKDVKTGLEHHELLVTKGTFIYLGLSAANRSTAIWGPDAAEFKPERWLGKTGSHLTADNARLPSIYYNTMTFLGGGRACPGMKFALLEIKLVLSVLLQAFSFEKAAEAIDWRLGITLTPYVKGEEKDGPKVPVKVSILD